VYDSRTEWLEQISPARNITVITHESPAEIIPTLPANAFVVCMTKGHTTDRPILQRALAERNFPFIGAIGSEAKAAVLRRELVAAGLSAERARQFHCPLGLDFGTTHPHEIAMSIAAQLLSERDRARAAVQ
jgi:xanthine dehydrogenase accessory factor